jgi:hypothetical protein
MAKYQLFGSLVRIPSAFLNAIQDALYAQRATGPGNALSLNLEGAMPSFDQRTVEFNADSAAINSGFPQLLDDAIDWRDRYIKIRWKFDYLNDIRPGKPGDYIFAEEEGETKVYTVTGGFTIPVSPAWGFVINSGNGHMGYYKRAGYLYVEIESGTQLKERS